MTNPYLVPYSYPYSDLYPYPETSESSPYTYYPYYPYYQMYPPSYPTTPTGYPLRPPTQQQLFPFSTQAPFHTYYPHHVGTIGGYGQFHLHSTSHAQAGSHGIHVPPPHVEVHL